MIIKKIGSSRREGTQDLSLTDFSKKTNEEGKRQDQIQTIIDLQNLISRVIEKSVLKGWLSIDLTAPQLKVLFLLQSYSWLKMSKLAEILNRNLSTVTGIVDHLVEQGLVMRGEQESDRRVVVIHITDQGRQMCQSLLEINNDELFNIYNNLSAEELAVILQGAEYFLKAAIGKQPKPANAPEHSE